MKYLFQKIAKDDENRQKKEKKRGFRKKRKIEHCKKRKKHRFLKRENITKTKNTKMQKTTKLGQQKMLFKFNTRNKITKVSNRGFIKIFQYYERMHKVNQLPLTSVTKLISKIH